MTRVPVGPTPLERLDAFQQRHSWLGLPIAVAYRFFENSGMHLVAALAYYALVAAVPLLLLAAIAVATMLDFFPDLQPYLVRSPIASIPMVGERIRNPDGGNPSIWLLVIAVAGSLYGGIGIGQAFQHAMNTIWSVPRNQRPNPFTARLRSLGILGLAAVSITLSTGLAMLGPQLRLGRGWSRPLTFLMSVPVNAAIFIVAMRLATAHPMPVRRILAGAIGCGIVWQLFQQTGMAYFRTELPKATTAGQFANLVLALVGVLHLTALALVLAGELNAVLVRGLWPRALLTPFTDRVRLTDADRISYAAQARMMRYKAYQHVKVEWTDHHDPALDRIRTYEADVAEAEVHQADGAAPAPPVTR